MTGAVQATAEAKVHHRAIAEVLPEVPDTAEGHQADQVMAEDHQEVIEDNHIKTVSI